MPKRYRDLPCDQKVANLRYPAVITKGLLETSFGNHNGSNISGVTELKVGKTGSRPGDLGVSSFAQKEDMIRCILMMPLKCSMDVYGSWRYAQRLRIYPRYGGVVMPLQATIQLLVRERPAHH
jgi:hypothetical protein